MQSETIVHSAVPLQPVRRWWFRFIIFLGLAAIPFFSRAEWYKRVIFAAGLAGWLGSWPQARIRGDRFERVMYIFFVPARTKRWALDRFNGIQPDSDPREIAEAWMFFGIWWLFWAAFDSLMPWLGGSYKLWLRAHSGRRVLAWQGNNQDHFQANLELLQRRSALPIDLGS